MKLLAVCALAASLFGAPAQRPVPWPEPPRDFGVLDVESEPPAEIAIDGAATGLWTPQHRLRLPVGRHKVTLFRREGHPSSVGIIIRAGETTHVTIHFAW